MKHQLQNRPKHAFGHTSQKPFSPPVPQPKGWWCISFFLLFTGISITSYAQLATGDDFNRGFEDGNNGGNFWNNTGAGTAVYNSTTPPRRTGSFAGSYTTSSSTNQRWDQTGYAVSVPGGQYVHLIYWAIRGGTSASQTRTTPAITLSNHGNVLGSEIAPGGSYVRVTTSRQNSSAGSEMAYPSIHTRSNNSGQSVTPGYDDIVIYASNNSNPDLTAPTAASCFQVTNASAAGIGLSWTNGTDAETGVRGTLILRTSASSTSTATFLSQGTYTTSTVSADGVRTINGFDIIANLPAGQTTFTDASLVANTRYRYAIVHYDLALNYSAAVYLNSRTAITDISQSIQSVSKPTGGTFTNGDEVRINVSFAVPNNVTIHNTRTRIYLPAGLSYIPNSMAILDNKGMVYGSGGTITTGVCSGGLYTNPGGANSLTDAAGDDRGRYVSGVNSYAEIILGELPNSQSFAELENNTNLYSGGRLRGGSSRPTFGPQAIIVVSIRATITGTIGDIIPVRSESFFSFLETSATGSLQNFIIDASNNTERFIELVVSNPALPASYTARGANLFSAFNNGTFGGGTFIDGSGLNIPGNPSSSPNFVLQNISTNNQPNDGNFSVSKNTSRDQLPGLDIDYAIDHAGRVFTHFYIVGDHTGAANQALGNPAPAATDSAGYMMVVNADYVPKRLVSQNTSNLCPGTFYNFKAWFKNICPSCGVDSDNGTNLRTAFTDPRRSGVKPNLTFDVNGRAYYTTGPIDTADQWIQKEFVFSTGTNSGDFDFSIRNNANGGDGNDWVLDDIQIITRGPVATANVRADPFVDPDPATFCAGQRFLVVGNWLEPTGSFSQYDNYQFQYSAGGPNGPWTAMAPIAELPTPNDPFNPANGRIDSIVSEQFNTPNQDVYFRVVVATQAANISTDDAAPCQVTAYSSNVIRIGTCILPVKLLQFKASRVGQQVYVQWNTADVNKLRHFELERSTNGIQFATIATILPNQANRPFEFGYNDKPTIEADRIYYRLKMVHDNGEITYSAIEWVGWNQSVMQVSIQPNPARDFVQLNWSGVRPNQKVQVQILSMTGQPMYSEMLTVQQGPSQRIKLPNIPSGMYLIKITDAAKQFSQTIKLNKQ